LSRVDFPCSAFLMEHLDRKVILRVDGSTHDPVSFAANLDNAARPRCCLMAHELDGLGDVTLADENRVAPGTADTAAAVGSGPDIAELVVIVEMRDLVSANVVEARLDPIVRMGGSTLDLHHRISVLDVTAGQMRGLTYLSGLPHIEVLCILSLEGGNVGDGAEGRRDRRGEEGGKCCQLHDCKLDLTDTDWCTC
jgi:hypothetical protein